MKKQKRFQVAFSVMGLFFVMASFLAGCTAKTDDLKTSLLADDTNVSDDANSGDSNSNTDSTKTDCGENMYWDGNTQKCIQGSTNDGECDSSGNCYKPDDGNSVDCGENMYWDGANQKCVPSYTDDGECDSAGNCYKPEYNNQPQNNNCDENGNCQKFDNNNGGGQGQGQGDCFGEGNDDCREKSLKADYRDIERMERELKQLMKQDEENSDKYQSYIDTLESLKAKYDSATTQEEVDSIRQEAWAIQDVLQTYRMAAEIERTEKDIERMAKDSEKSKEYLTKMLDQVSDEWKTKIEEQLAAIDKMQELQTQILEAMKAGEDFDKIDELRWEADDLRWAMDDFWKSFEEIQNTQWIDQMIKDVENSIQEFTDKAYPNLSDDQKVKADEIIEVAKALVEEAKKARDDGDTELLKDIQQRLDELRMKAGDIFGKQKSNFKDMGFDEKMDGKFEDFTGDMSYEKQLEIVKKILSSNPDMIQQILLGDPVLAEKTLKIFNKIPEELQNEFLEKKAKLETLYTEILEKNSDIGNYKDDILGFNYFGEAVDSLISALEEVSGGSMKLSDLISKLDELKKLSKEAKYEAGIVSFSDYDDGDWYYDSVEGMTKFLKGKDGKFAGGDNITFAETLKIVLEKFGKGESSGSSSYANAQNHWANGYYVTAEQLGLTLLDPDHLITRGEMARLITEVTLGAPVSHTESTFSDLSTTDEYFDYLETLHDYGVIGGDTGGSGLPTVRSNDNINRAEAAKVINTASQKFGVTMEDVDSEDLQNIVKGLDIENNFNFEVVPADTSTTGNGGSSDSTDSTN